jgi:hypothetical protein
MKPPDNLVATEYDGYFVNELGEVWSYLARFNQKRKKWRRVKTPINVAGYPVFNIRGKKTVHVHIVMLTTFRGPRPNGYVSRHLDDNRSNNNLENLRWGTQKQNMEDCCNNGNIPRGTVRANAKLNELQVRIIRNYPDHYGHNTYLAKVFNITSSMVTRIRQRRIWAHVV